MSLLSRKNPTGRWPKNTVVFGMHEDKDGRIDVVINGPWTPVKEILERWYSQTMRESQPRLEMTWKFKDD